LVSTAEKLGAELLLVDAEPPADADGVLLDDEDGVLGDADGVLDDEDDCATASVDSAKSTAAVVTLRVLDMDRASLGLDREMPPSNVQALCR